MARLDRLGPAREIAQVGAAIGREFSHAVLAAVVPKPEAELASALDRLIVAGLLFRHGVPPHAVYLFKHALVQDAAYGTLLREPRRALHAKIVAAIEALYGNHLTEQIERLGHHAMQGHLWGKAATYLRQAGIKAQKRSANQEAVAQFEKALEALGHLPQERERIELEIDIRSIDLRNSLVPLGEYTPLLRHLREAERIAATFDDRPRLCRIFFSVSEYFRLMGDADEGVEAGQRAVSLATDLDDFALRIQANIILGAVYQRQGNYRDARDILMRNVEMLAREMAYESFGFMNIPYVSSRTWLSWSLAELGEFAEGKLRANEELEIATAVAALGFQFAPVHAYFAVGVLHLWQGEFPEAIGALERGLQHCRTGNVAIFIPITAGCLGYACALSGRLAEGISLLEESSERFAAMNVAMNRSLILSWLGEAYLLAGRTEEACRSGEEAVAMARANKEKGHYAWAMRFRGELAARPDAFDIAAAVAHYNQAISLAEPLGMSPLVARCYLGLGRSHWRAGELQQAESHFATAAAIYRELNMMHWVQVAQQEPGNGFVAGGGGEH